MARILTTAIVADIRGKLAGTVFSRNRSGNYVRTKTTPINPQSYHQQHERAVMGAISQMWGDLTEEEREAWRSVTDQWMQTNQFGNQESLSGKALFQKLNRNLGVAGSPFITEPPLPEEMPVVEIEFATLEADSLDISLVFSILGDTEVPSGYALLIRATPALRPGIDYFKNRFRNLQLASASETSPLSLNTRYNARFGGQLAVGQKVAIEASLINTITGQRSVPYVFSAIAEQGTP